VCVVAQLLFWNIFNDLCLILVPDFYIFVGVESVGVVIKNKTRSAAAVMQ
jgi:hypothetical protein